jgi:hypothetical protein
MQFTVVFFILTVALYPDHSLVRTGVTALVTGVIFGGLMGLVRRYQQRIGPG